MPTDSSSQFSGPIAWMASNSVAANLLMILFLLGGLVLAAQVKQEVFPEFSTDIVQVKVSYPGASPDEVEQGIVLSIEDRVRGLDGVKDVTSNAGEGSAFVVVELLRTANPSKVLQDVKNEVDSIQSFPEEAETPIVSLLESRRNVISLILYGEQSEDALREMAEQVRDELLQDSRVTLVELEGTKPLEIAIEIPGETLRRYELSLPEVAGIIERNALELPAGRLKTSSGEVLLRTKDRRDYASEYLDLPIRSRADGTLVKLSDIAEVVDGFEDTDLESSFNGLPAVRINLFRVGDETPNEVALVAQEYAERLNKTLSKSIQVALWDDASEKLEGRMNLLIKNAAIGLLLVLILLGIFIEVRLAFWVTLGIPISILGSFLFLPISGASINMISLFAFIITLGIIVDDAVVMGENIYEKREKGLDPLNAAIVGAHEISAPIVFAVLTNIVAFIPLFFVPGVSGKFFMQIPAVVVGVFVVSLIESLFILPAHLSHKPSKARIWTLLNRPKEKFSKKLDSFIKLRYAPAMERAVKRRYLTFAVAVMALAVSAGLVAAGKIRFSFLPKIDADVITAQATLPIGSPIEETRKIREMMLEAAKRVAEKQENPEIVQGLFAQIGRSLVSFGAGPSFASDNGGHVVAVQAGLVEAGEREISGVEFANAWREEIGEPVGLDSLVFKAETGASEGAPIEIFLSAASQEELETAATILANKIREYDGTSDIDDGVSGGKSQLTFKLTPLGNSLGLTTRELAAQVRGAFFGADALRQQRGRNEVRVRVRLPETERENLQSLRELTIRTPNGGEIFLSDAAEISFGRSYTVIKRRNGRQVVTVSSDVDTAVTSAGQIITDLQANVFPELKRRYGVDFGFSGEREAQSDTLGSLKIGFVISLIVIFGLLAVAFNSYAQPLIVMLSIPFGIIGAIGGHFLLGYGLSIISMFGLIALTGVVVNDSLVLVVTANRFRREGMSAERAVSLAGQRRLRPIMLTSLTTFFGLAPMIFETSVQARFLIPMAISIGFGILFATVIILVLVPSVYLILEDVKLFLSSLSSKQRPQSSTPIRTELDESSSLPSK